MTNAVIPDENVQQKKVVPILYLVRVPMSIEEE